MRTITMQTIKDGKYWQIAPFEYDGKDQEAALLERLDIAQIEAQMEKDLAGSEQQ